MEELNIEGFAFGGKAFGRLPSGKVCFVRGASPGERILARLLSEKSAHSEAALVEILEASPSRIDRTCPLAPAPEGRGPLKGVFCPGCSYQHLPYEVELDWKNRQFADFMERGLGVRPERLTAPFGVPSRYGWRNKLKLSCEVDGPHVRFGYFGEDNRSILEIDGCPLAHPEINRLLAEKSSQPGFRSTLRHGMSLNFRHTERDGAVFWRNKASPKNGWLMESLPQGDFMVPRDSFFQVNPPVAAELLRRVEKAVSSLRPDTVVDLYCGVGAFSIVAAKAGAGKVFGVELDGAAVDAARTNAKRHSLDNCSFLAGDAGKAFRGLLNGIHPERSLLILDPPRGGLPSRTLENACSSRIKDILYISCSPDTLCRDLRRLMESGYSVRESGLLDMFPATAHFESVTHLELA